MKLTHFPETDSAYINLVDEPAVEAEELMLGVVFDFAADGRVVGIDIDQASRFTSLRTAAGQQAQSDLAVGVLAELHARIQSLEATLAAVDLEVQDAVMATQDR